MSSEGDPVPKQDYLVDFVAAFKWNDLPRLARLLHDKQFKGKRGLVTWGERPAAATNTKTRQMLTTADILLDTLAGGDTEAFMADLIRREKHLVVANGLRAERPTASEQAKMELLLSRLRDIAERLESTSTPEVHGARLDILRSLKGVRGFKLLTAAGWRISKEVWAKVSQDVIVTGNLSAASPKQLKDPRPVLPSSCRKADAHRFPLLLRRPYAPLSRATSTALWCPSGTSHVERQKMHLSLAGR